MTLDELVKAGRPGAWPLVTVGGDKEFITILEMALGAGVEVSGELLREAERCGDWYQGRLGLWFEIEPEPDRDPFTATSDLP